MNRIRKSTVSAVLVAVAASVFSAGAAMAATSARSTLSPVTPVAPIITPAPPTPTTPTTVPPPSTTLHALGANLPTGTPVAARSLRKKLPASADLSASAVPVGDQGPVGSCTAWTFAYDMLGWYARHSGSQGQPFAPMYAYNYVDHGNNKGTFANDILNVLVSKGEVPQVGYGGSPVGYQHVATASEDAAASVYRIAGYTTLFRNGAGGGDAGIAAIEASIAGGNPVGIAFVVRPGFDSLGHAATDVDNDTTGVIRGGHEVMALGYDASGLLIQNSWGKAWGNKGFGRLSWDVVRQDVYEAMTMQPFVFVHLSIPSGPDALLGTATTGVVRVDNGAFEYQGFGNKWVLSFPSTGAWEMDNGPLYDYWTANLQSQVRLLGYPTGSTTPAAGGGTWQTFSGGAITSNSKYGTHGVTGTIYDSWVSAGGVGGVFGYATSEPYSSGIVVTQPQTCQHFVGGTLCMAAYVAPIKARLTA